MSTEPPCVRSFAGARLAGGLVPQNAGLVHRSSEDRVEVVGEAEGQGGDGEGRVSGGDERHHRVVDCVEVVECLEPQVDVDDPGAVAAHPEGAAGVMGRPLVAEVHPLVRIERVRLEKRQDVVAELTNLAEQVRSEEVGPDLQPGLFASPDVADRVVVFERAGHHELQPHARPGDRIDPFLADVVVGVTDVPVLRVDQDLGVVPVL